MTWRWLWARSRVTALVASGLVWLVAAALSPAFVAGYALLGVAAVANWRTRALRWWRFGARMIEPTVAEAVWRSLGPVAWLRGRSQPVLWAGRWVGQDVVAPDRHTLVLSEQVIRAVGRQELADRELRRQIVRAFALAQLNRSRTVAAVEIICLPWAILADIAGKVCCRWAAQSLVVFSWKCRWLFIGLAGVELYYRGQWVGVVMLGLTAAATVTTPRWNRAWAKRRADLADNLERAGLDAPSAGRRELVSTPRGPCHHARRDCVAWAKGLHPLEAAVELLVRAVDGWFASPGYPWIQPCDQPGWWWLNHEAIADDNLLALSGGE